MEEEGCRAWAEEADVTCAGKAGRSRSLMRAGYYVTSAALARTCRHHVRPSRCLCKQREGGCSTNILRARVTNRSTVSTNNQEFYCHPCKLSKAQKATKAMYVALCNIPIYNAIAKKYYIQSKSLITRAAALATRSCHPQLRTCPNSPARCQS